MSSLNTHAMKNNNASLEGWNCAAITTVYERVCTCRLTAALFHAVLPAVCSLSYPMFRFGRRHAELRIGFWQDIPW